MIKLTNCNKYYGTNEYNKVHALNDVTLEFDDLGITLILGESGSGKTTLLNCLSGLDTFSDGTYEENFNNKVSFIFQDYQLMDNLTVKENLLFVEKNEDIIMEKLKKFELVRFADKKINELSGGQKQRIAIVRALLNGGKVIFADEPTGNLDQENSKKICEILKDISKEIKVFVVSHNKDLFSEYADHIITLSDGKVIGNRKINSFEDKKEEKEDCPTINKNKMGLRDILLLKKTNYKKNVFYSIFDYLFVTILLTTICFGIILASTTKKEIYAKTFNDFSLGVAEFGFYKNKDLDLTKYLDDQLIEKVENKKIDYSVNYHNVGNISCNGYTFNQINVVEGNKKLNLECGTYELKEKDIVLSNYAANQLFRFIGVPIDNDMGGMKNILNHKVRIYNDFYTIVGVEKKSSDRVIHDVKIEDYDESLNYFYCNNNTFNNIHRSILNESGLSVVLYSEDETIHTHDGFMLDMLEDDKLLAGSLPVNSNEVVISRSMARAFFKSQDDYSNAIGKTIIIASGIYNEPKFKTKMIITGVSNNNSFIMKENFGSVFPYTINYYNLGMHRKIGLLNNSFNEKSIEQLNSLNLYYDGLLNNCTTQSYSLIFTISAVLLITSLPLAGLLIFYLFFITKQRINNEKRIIGILKSIRKPNKEIAKVLSIDLVIPNLISLISSVLITLVVIIIFNSTLQSRSTAIIDLVSFKPLTLIVLGAIVVLITLLSLSISLKKLNKKSDVDLIYER